VSSEDKASNRAKEIKGKIKEWFGGKTHNERLRQEGVGDQVDANARQAGEHLKDAWHDTKDAVTGQE
jgi:uncharacterized protein YjbJ (UPF0337 family)